MNQETERNNMDDHLGMYIYLKFGHHYDQLFSDKELIKKVNAHYSIGLHDKEEFLKLYAGLGKPKTYQLVKRLADMGFAPKTIGKWLEISPSTISIHLAKPDEKAKEYKNYKLIEYMNAKLRLIQQYGHEYL
jgi:hypothetical protein